MDLTGWFRQRGPAFVWQRGLRLLDRYGFSTRKAAERAGRCLRRMIELGCRPTFFVPGMVADRHPELIRGLAAEGANLGVHSYNHIDLRSIPPQEAVRQLKKGWDALAGLEVKATGFRCPYLSFNEAILPVLPAETFLYSSNQAVSCPTGLAGEGTVLEVVDRFYTPARSQELARLPYRRGGLLEIPVCVPDDIQLLDGYKVRPDRLGAVWVDMLREITAQGELFNLMFHPELADLCAGAFAELLGEAARPESGVWITDLEEIARWWQERIKFKALVSREGTGWHLRLACSPRVTIVATGMPQAAFAPPQNQSLREISLPDPLPGIALAPDVAEADAEFLKDLGYLTWRTSNPSFYALHLNQHALERFGNRRELSDWILTCPAPLLRVGAWPDGKKAALAVTGDLDALSLIDYSARLWTN